MNITQQSGDYLYQPGGTTYSCGARALPGYEIRHITLMRPLPLARGLEAIAAYLQAAQRPPQALCGLQLRCPSPYSFEGFAAFNDTYCALLQKHDMLHGSSPFTGQNPIARTNVFPLAEPLTEQTIHAFSYTAPLTEASGRPSFVASGAGELVQSALSQSAVVRRGETSNEAMMEKAACVMEIMQSRLDALEVSWDHVTTVNIYTVHNITPFLKSAILNRMGNAARLGVHWHLSRPPIDDIEFEMDLRGVATESYEELR